MTIIEDTRQQSGKHNIKHEHFEQLGINLIRSKLPFGDYCLPPEIAIDTKQNMLEIVQDMVSDHQRFKRECLAAKDAGCTLIILIENTDGITDVSDVHTWFNPRSYYAPKATQGPQLQRAMETMHERYGVVFKFCKPEESAEYIKQLLGGVNG